MLLATSLNVTSVALLAIGSYVAYLVSKKVYQVDTFLEDVRARSIELSGWCQANGLPIMARLLTCVAIGDKVGQFHTFKEVLALLGKPDELKVAVDKFLNVQLDKKLATAEGREELLAGIESRLKIKIDRKAISDQASTVELVGVR